MDSQDEIIDFLSRPESFGVTGPVERVDTHAAIIFLAGAYAYKLKRAVRYDYLDFSTVEKRRAVCEAELRLNRRTAPDLYLEVRGINRTADGHIGFGSGKPLDWLVVMRRFPAESLLSEVARRGELDDRLVRDLADVIATFHDAAAIIRCDDGAARMGAVIDGNRTSMEDAGAQTWPEGHVALLHRESRDALARLSALLDRRGREGRVRHCHGDLHLANICLWDGRPTLFDCLEFDDRLAQTDLLYDLAFLLMDIWSRGLKAQACLLFNRYLDRRPEEDGVAALPLFLSMRAAVRAHVSAAAAARAREGQVALRDRARRHMEDARAFLVQSRRRLIAIGGLSGSGKSSLARMLAPHADGAPGARIVRSDVLRKRLHGVTPETPLGPAAYTPEQGRAVYAAMAEEASMLLKGGRTVIADAVFADPREREEINAVATDCGVAFDGLWLDAPSSTLRSRADRRMGDASDATAAVVDRQLAYDLGDLGNWQRIDNSGTLDEAAERAKAALGIGRGIRI